MSRAGKLRRREEKLLRRANFLEGRKGAVRELQRDSNDVVYAVLNDGRFVNAGKRAV